MYEDEILEHIGNAMDSTLRAANAEVSLKMVQKSLVTVDQIAVQQKPNEGKATYAKDTARINDNMRIDDILVTQQVSGGKDKDIEVKPAAKRILEDLEKKAEGLKGRIG